MTPRSSLWLACALSLSVAACSGSSGSESHGFTGAPLGVFTSDRVGLRVSVRSDPSPPARGVNAVELFVVDQTGAPRDGLQLKIVPWMPAHGHGASVTPSITARGGGRYVADDVDLYMPGRWELRTTITGLEGAGEDHVAPTFDVR